MKTAVIGTGISGLTAAWLLREDHDLTIFEANDYVGGHTNTVEVRRDHGTYAVDTGFIVFNDWTYPNFIRLLDRIGVESQASEMSLSLRCDRTGLEYAGNSLNTLFAQRRNLFSPSFIRMVFDIYRFNLAGKRFLTGEIHDDPTFREFLDRRRYSPVMIDKYLIPMLAAIWSADPRIAGEFPARHFLGFLENHGLLNIVDRPIWRVIKGGSWKYVERLTAPFRDRIRLRTPVESICRFEDRVEIRARGGGVESFDQVVIATHSDQALRMLADPSDAEREVLGAIPYQPNEAVLHTDASILPRSRCAWASWNYRIEREERDRATLTYNMNILQSLPRTEDFLVTLNAAESVDSNRMIRRIQYEHPLYSSGAIAAQKRREEINGTRRTYFAGAYWGYGFHEDGVKSALEVGRHFGKGL